MTPPLAGIFKFHARLLDADVELATRIKVSGCLHCGSRLDVANYPRKVRGLTPEEELAGGYGLRLSLCCAREGCRRRMTPPSRRFFGRRVYASVVFLHVMLAAKGARDEETPTIASPPTRPTRRRWSDWWRVSFVCEPWFAVLASRLAVSLDLRRPVDDLVRRFGGSLLDRISDVLGLLAPLTTRSCPFGSSPLLRVR